MSHPNTHFDYPNKAYCLALLVSGHCSYACISYTFTEYQYRIEIAIFGQYHIDIVSKLKSWYRVVTIVNTRNNIKKLWVKVYVKLKTDLPTWSLQLGLAPLHRRPSQVSFHSSPVELQPSVATRLVTLIQPPRGAANVGHPSAVSHRSPATYKPRP